MSLNKQNKKRYIVDAGLAGTYVFDSTALDAVGQGVTTTALTAIGVTLLDVATPPARGFIGANSPKPPKFKLPGIVIGQSTTTFGAIGTTLANASAQNWKITKRARFKPVTLRGQSRSVFVIVGGINYAWNMHVDQYEQLLALGVLTTLGISLCDPDQVQTYVWGSTIPKPAKVGLVIASVGINGGAGSVDTITTFCAQVRENNLPEGWKIIKPRRDWSAA
ncbi:hypothetical protein NG798_23085 [Ancylothrix sp. C2]|uniref:hypothetical protein n=1 Tax=Ancylothrix sp. D3o TaxID=2953691 RepID=UPI0021BBA416|nr:hypothetical protein [Ancylothrix sp. D3o]MCT7952688.1 hypothetical protein [Ancylothrix sp. D3o]